MDDSLRLRARAARTALERGALRGPALLDALHAVPFLDRDAWTDEVLGIEPPPPGGDLPRGAVPYLPCGVEEILAMVRDVAIQPDDELVDIGSGLGRVAILAHLLTGVRAVGVEIQETLVAKARARAAELGLARVEFVHANAAEQALDGSIFFLYAPCNGRMLAQVTERLAEVARRRRIVVCTVGLELADVPWLLTRPSSSVALAIYRSQ